MTVLNCQPVPPSGQIRPGVCYTFGPPAGSWWTPQHIAAACFLAAILAAAVLARHRLHEIAWAIWHHDDPSSVLCPPVHWDGGQWTPDGHQVTVREWLALPRHERDRRKAEFRAADEALQVNSEAEEQAGVTGETETYHVLNGRVNDLWGTVPWWCRR
jgi:hypothetical protein